VRLSLVVAAVLVLMIAPTLLLAELLAWSQMSENPLSNLALGLVCTLIAWLFVAVFHLTREKLTMAVPDRQRFLPQVRSLLEEMGYEVTVQTAEQIVTRPCFNAFLFGGGMRVQMHGKGATIYGPKISAEILRNRLRMEHHLLRIHAVLDERRSAEPLLKRVEICMRVKPEQIAAAQAQVIDPLAQTGAVVCEMHVLVQSEEGVPESTIEECVRPWAEQNDIDCNIHKHRAKFYQRLPA
jgi:hypothetical protein